MDDVEVSGFSGFVAEHGPGCQRLALMICGDHHQAQDIAQAAFVKVFLNWPTVSRAQDPTAYLRRVVVNQCIDEGRRRSRRHRHERELPDEVEVADQPNLADGVASRGWVGQRLAQLSAQQRAVLVLRFYDDLTDVQIAHELGLSVGTVKTHIARGLARLREPAVEEDHHV